MTQGKQSLAKKRSSAYGGAAKPSSKKAVKNAKAKTTTVIRAKKTHAREDEEIRRMLTKKIASKIESQATAALAQQHNKPLSVVKG